MNIKVVISSFGRIGRLALRQIIKTEGVGVVAVNDLTPAGMLLHSLKYDSTQGRFRGAVELKEDAIVVDGKEIKIFTKPNPEELLWGELGVDVVLECTNFFTSKTKAEAHIRASARKVVISAPDDNGVKTAVYDVDQSTLDGSKTVISTASCTTSCLTPMAAVLQCEFDIVEGLMTTIHTFTGDQNILDVLHRRGDLRRTHAASLDIVSNSTGTVKTISLAIPGLNGKLDGSAQRMSVATGSLTELVSIPEHPVTEEEINAAMKAAVSGSYGYTEEQLVSPDAIGMEEGSLLDTTQTRMINIGDRQSVKAAVWYDNETSCTCQLVHTLKHPVTRIQSILVVDS